jgi:hypothetical protein
MGEAKEAADGGSALSSSPAISRSIDIEKLAEKVYQLMRADARLQRGRGVRRSTRG